MIFMVIGLAAGSRKGIGCLFGGVAGGILRGGENGEGGEDEGGGDHGGGWVESGGWFVAGLT